jgi:hypothetical protein
MARGVQIEKKSQGRGLDWVGQKQGQKMGGCAETLCELTRSKRGAPGLRDARLFGGVGYGIAESLFQNLALRIRSGGGSRRRPSYGYCAHPA